MTYEEYAEKLNRHADTCTMCAASKKTSTTFGVCDEGQAIIDEWKASKHTDEDIFYARMNALAKELQLEEEQDADAGAN